MIYFDNSATTRPSPKVAEVLSRELLSDELYGNPGSIHKLGTKASRSYDAALKKAAELLHCGADELYFTSCGTENTNTVIEGYLSRNRRAGKTVITTGTEHKATLETVKRAEALYGSRTVYIKTLPDGTPDLEELENSIDDDTAMLCFTHVNNESGAILPLEKIVAIRDRKNRNTKIFLDCVQSLGKLPIDLSGMKIDMASFSGHKIHSVKGTGLMYIRKGINIDPLIVGGGQQKGMRSGTQSLFLADAFVTALEEAVNDRKEAYERVEKINLFLREELVKRKAVINSPADALPFVLNVAFDGFESETMLHALESFDICVSTVSACSSKTKAVSYVLLEMGIPRKTAANSVRLSFSKFNTMEEAEKFIETVDKIYELYALK